MKKSFYLLFLVVFAISTQSFGQFYKRFGYTQFFVSSPTLDIGATPAGTFELKYNVSEPSSSSAIAITTRPSLQFYISTNYGSSLGYELPVTAEYHLGANATDNTESGIGGLIGAGLSLQYLSGGYGMTIGPKINAGIKVSRYDILLFYMKGLAVNKNNVYGFAISIPIGTR